MGLDAVSLASALSGSLAVDSAGNFTFRDPSTLTFGAATGAKIGAAADKIGFYGAAPVVRPGGTPAAAADLATAIALVNSLRTALLALGLVS